MTVLIFRLCCNLVKSAHLLASLSPTCIQNYCLLYNLFPFPSDTYTLQELKVIESLSNGTTCFQCNFLTNSQSSACYVILKPDAHTLVCTNVSRLFERSFFREYTNGSIDSDVAKGCVDDVYTNLYDIEAYSVSNISSILDEPDIKIENVTLDGITYTTCKTSSGI